MPRPHVFPDVSFRRKSLREIADTKKRASAPACGIIKVGAGLALPEGAASSAPLLVLKGKQFHLDTAFLLGYIPWVEWEVEFTDEFGEWWNGLAPEEQDSVATVVDLLEERGPSLRLPYSSVIASSRHANMKELRIQHAGRPYRVLYAFDPRRSAILLIGGDKTGDNRWYDKFVPIADKLYDEHLAELKREENHGKKV